MLLVAEGLLASRLHAQYTFPPTEHGDMAATLTVESAKQTNEPGLGEVTLCLVVTGPSTLEVDEPHLGDAAAAWKERREPSERTVTNQRAAWRQVIRLKQSKPGLEPVPDVSLRFRPGPQDQWAEAKWVDILTHLRDLQGPPVEDEQPSAWRHWVFPVVLGLVIALALLAWRINKMRGPPPPSLAPEVWAARELDRIEQTAQPPRGEPEPYYTQISEVVRRYLVERFGFHALHQTTAEFLQTLHQVPPREKDDREPAPLFSADVETLLGEFFHRCDLAKFARASATPEECQRTTTLARELVRLTSERNGR